MCVALKTRVIITFTKFSTFLTHYTYWTFLLSSDNGTTIISEWVSYDVFTRITGISRISCAMNQYLSGLAFTPDSELGAYVWCGRCTNLSAGYMKEEGMCWTSDVKLVQGFNRSLSMPGERVVMDRIKIEYEDYLVNEFYRTRWSYVLCLILDGTCRAYIPSSYMYDC